MNNIIERLKQAYSADKAEALNLLPELFKAAEDGRIIELPCKVGDTVYKINPIWDITKCQIKWIGCETTTDKQQIATVFGANEFNGAYFTGKMAICEEEIGKTVFLTREEAEEALKERKNEM